MSTSEPFLTPGRVGCLSLVDMSLGALVTLQGAELPKAGLYVSLHSLT